MSGKRSRNKGASYERHIAKILTKWWGSQIDRVPQSGGWQKERITGDVAADDKFPFSVECKKQEGWHLEDILYKDSLITKWWKQCCDDCPDSKTPLLVFSRNYYPDFCTLKTYDFLSLCDGLSVRRFKIGGQTIIMFDEFLKHVNAEMFKE
jgi:hypothetical protein